MTPYRNRRDALQARASAIVADIEALHREMTQLRRGRGWRNLRRRSAHLERDLAGIRALLGEHPHGAPIAQPRDWGRRHGRLLLAALLLSLGVAALLSASAPSNHVSHPSAVDGSDSFPRKELED